MNYLKSTSYAFLILMMLVCYLVWYHCVFFGYFRLVSERTVEENILKKANQKRMLGDMAIEGGNFTTAFFKEVCTCSFFNGLICQRTALVIICNLHSFGGKV